MRIRLENLTKRYQEVTAVDHLNLDRVDVGKARLYRSSPGWSRQQKELFILMRKMSEDWRRKSGTLEWCFRIMRSILI